MNPLSPRWLVPFCVLLFAPQAHAQKGPERYLPPGSQLFFQYDGLDAHRAAYEKTVTGKLFAGDFGKFLSSVWRVVNDQIDPLLEKADAPPEVAKLVKEVPGLLSALVNGGMAIGIELNQINPPKAEATFIFPKNGGPNGALAKVVKMGLEKGNVPLQESKVGAITVQHAEFGPVQVAFWSDGDLACFTVTSDEALGVVKRGVEKGKNITSNPLYKSLASQKTFAVATRAYFDMEKLLKPIAEVSPQAEQVLDELGLASLKNVTMISGFDGPAERSIVDIQFKGPRKGLMALTQAAKGAKVNLSEMPPLPEDVTAFTMGVFNPVGSYDAVLQAVDGSVRLFNGDVADGIQQGIKQMELLVGVKFRDELVASIGDTYATYSAASDGPFGLGRVSLLKIKDSKKFVESLGKIYETFPGIPGVEFELKKKTFEGIDYLELHMGQGNFSTSSYALIDDWLVMGSFPQPVRAYILRKKGLIPARKAMDLAGKEFAKAPKDLVGFSYSDPKPMVNAILPMLPTLFGVANTAGKALLPEFQSFDISLIPHPYEVTRHLFPNTSYTIDMGDRLRIESRSSIGQ